MKLPCVLGLLAGAAVLAVLAFFASSFIDVSAYQPEMLLAVGVFFGAVIGGLAVVLRPHRKGGRSISTIYIGNLPFNAGKDEIRNLLADYGEVFEIRLVRDRRSGRSKGYCFVEMETRAAKAVMRQLNGTEYAGRTLRINEAKEKGQEE